MSILLDMSQNISDGRTGGSILHWIATIMQFEKLHAESKFAKIIFSTYFFIET